MATPRKSEASRTQDAYTLLKDELREVRRENAALRASLRIANERIDAERRRADVAEASRTAAWRTAGIWTAPKPEA